MRKPLHLIAMGTACLFAAFLSAEPKMPDGFVAAWTDPSGLTWRETGILPMPFGEAIVALKAAMKKQGYVLCHDITGDAFGDLHLFLWLKEREEATIMIWPDTRNATGVCWGVTGANANTNTAGKVNINEKDN